MKCKTEQSGQNVPRAGASQTLAQVPDRLPHAEPERGCRGACPSGPGRPLLRASCSPGRGRGRLLAVPGLPGGGAGGGAREGAARAHPSARPDSGPRPHSPPCSQLAVQTFRSALGRSPSAGWPRGTWGAGRVGRCFAQLGRWYKCAQTEPRREHAGAGPVLGSGSPGAAPWGGSPRRGGDLQAGGNRCSSRLGARERQSGDAGTGMRGRELKSLSAAAPHWATRGGITRI